MTALDTSTHPAQLASPPAAPSALCDNAQIAQSLRDMATLLEAQGDNPYRVAAYRRAAGEVTHQPRSLHDILLREGEAGLDALPGVGPHIAAAIAELLSTGRWRRLEELLGEADPDALFRTIPGVDAELAHRLHDELGVQTLEALAQVARQGRLDRLPGIGAHQAAAIQSALAQMLVRHRAHAHGRPAGEAAPEPPVSLLLDIDHDYRALAQAGSLPTIAPRRFNPEGKAWLPVLHTERAGWHLTALFSNTARAHALGHERDWVVLYAENPEHDTHQYTVVTASRGPLAGQRVVRGREADCSRLRWAQAAGTPPPDPYHLSAGGPP